MTIRKKFGVRVFWERHYDCWIEVEASNPDEAEAKVREMAKSGDPALEANSDGVVNINVQVDES